MISVLRPALILLMLLAAAVRPGLASKCAGRDSVCQAYAKADAVFIGRVASLDPDVNSLWGPDPAKAFERAFPGQAPEEIADNESAETTAKLRRFLVSLFRGPVTPAISSARTTKELMAAWDSLQEGGQTVRFEVQVAYKGLPSEAAFVEVHTDFFMGYSVTSVGETYLVYAHRGQGRRFEMGRCGRSARASSAGDDLAYLHFIQHGGRRSSRLYGFVSAHKGDQSMHLTRDEVAKPLEYVWVALRAPGLALFTSTDREGRFVFDGLEPGNYEATLYGEGDWPFQKNNRLGSPIRVKLREYGCERILFQIDPPKEEK